MVPYALASTANTNHLVVDGEINSNNGSADSTFINLSRIT
jgi:hypothetical protein